MNADDHDHHLSHHPGDDVDLTLDPTCWERFWDAVPYVSYKSTFLLVWQLLMVACVVYVSVCAEINHFARRRRNFDHVFITKHASRRAQRRPIKKAR